MKANLRPAVAVSSPVADHHRTLMGRDQRALTRAKIIECSIHIFAQKGPDAPVIDDFIKAANISRGTFYNYFQTTHELLEVTMARLSDEMIAAIVPVVDKMPNPVLRFATAARIFYRKAANDKAFCRFLSSVSNKGALLEKRVRADLKEAQRLGLIEVRNIELAYVMAAGVMDFALRKLGETGVRKIPGDEVIQVMLKGLGVSQDLITEALNIPLPKLAFAVTKFE